MATNSSAEACVASSTTGGATPASSASCQRAATTHHRSPATRPGNIHCGCGVTRSFPADDRELEELLGHHRTDDVEAEVGAFSAAVAVAEIAGHGIDRARLQLAAEDVHDGSLGRRRPGLPQAASRDTPDTTITRHGAARSTWRTGSGETRLRRLSESRACRSDHDQLVAVRHRLLHDCGAHVASSNNSRRNPYPIRVSGRSRALEQSACGVFGVHQMCVEREQRWDLDHRNCRDRRTVVGSEPTGDLECLDRLGACVERNEQPPVAARDLKAARGCLRAHASNARRDRS